MPTISALTVNNFKRVKSVDIAPGSRQLVILGGRNAQGKSSTLDAIAAALVGGKAMPSEPVHRGEDKGLIEITLANGIVIRRTLTRKADGKTGGSLTITTADGMRPAGGPQKWLDSRVGAMTVDPLAFMGRDDKAQANHLREVAGIDTTEVDARIKDLRDDRRLKGREAKAAEGAASSATRYPDAPAVAPEPAITSAADLIAEVQAAEATQRTVQDAERTVNDARAAVDKGVAAVQEVDAEIVRLEALLTEACAKRERYAKALDVRRDSVADSLKALDAAKANAIDPAPIRARLATLEQANTAARAEAAAVARKVQANADAADLQAKATRLRGEYDAMTQAIAAAEAERARILAEAALPVDGLGLSEDGVVTFRGLPLSQASRAEQMRVSMAIALAGTDDDDGIRIALIRDASLLDADSMQMVADLAAEMDAQVWLERVGDADDGAVIIEDGGVVA